MNAQDRGAEPAYPVEGIWNGDGSFKQGVQTGNATGYAPGLTKREAFAMAAMQGILAAGLPGSHDIPNECAAEAVAHADALLAQLNQEPRT